ncbi:Sterol regulatory element-binding protein [Paramyrothecium foliicola]|nr:Sterol regulatory element-binding protein [Paramyrothecium foliicola]
MTQRSIDESQNRRTHKKSRTGCITCKKRHVKCDEARPRCAKCVYGDRACLYAAVVDRRHDQLKSSTDPADDLGSNSSSQAATPSPAAILGLVANAGVPEAPRGSYNALHMALLYYAHMNMKTYMGANSDVSPVIESALDNAYRAPYLLDQLLALAALHRSTLEEERRSLFLHQATELQTRAIGQFNEAKESINEDNFMPCFLFATLLGVHVLRNTITDNQHSVSAFISAFVDYTRVHLGIRASTLTYWDRIRNSSLAPLMGIVSIGEATNELEAGLETSELRARLESLSDPTSPPVVASIEALQRIQWVLDMTKHDPSSFFIRINATMTWPLVISDEYIDALYQRRPEALAVLVFYLAVVHRNRDFWVFEACGRRLVEELVNNIGPFWSTALKWPLEIMSTSE